VSDIPQALDQFIAEADTDAALLPPRFMPTLTGRFAIYVAPEVEVDELRKALNAAGFAMTAHAEGWCVDKVHAFALVQEPANDATVSESPIHGLVDDPEGRN
jgi:hypothetical protein